MYYHLKDYIYIARFRDETIILDTLDDRYMICSQNYFDVLENLINQTDVHSDCVQKLIGLGFIENKNYPYPFHLDSKPSARGVSNVDWKLSLKNKKALMSQEVLQAFAMLVKVNFYLKYRGFYNTIKYIKKLKKSQQEYLFPTEEGLIDLSNTVNRACFVYPTRTKCLEWAITFVGLSLIRGWKCNLEIGVQNYPFLSHAWVECNGKVVQDEQNLRKDLAIVLNEPFRK